MLKILGCITAVAAVFVLISGFFVGMEQVVGSAAEKAGYIFGYEMAGLTILALFYVLLGVLYKVNNK